MSPIALTHVGGAVVGLLSGFTALSFRKGSGLHGAAGTVFSASMIGMTASAAYAAAFIKFERINVIVALLTMYLVVTGWRAAKRRDGTIGIIDRVALALILANGAAAIAFGLQLAKHPNAFHDGMPTPPYFIFGSVALLCGVSDIRMLRRGSLTGARRMARHLWRMCLALLIATLSLYPGRPQVFPKWLRDTNLLYVPAVILVCTMIFWLYRVKRRRRIREATPFPAAQDDLLVRKVA